MRFSGRERILDRAYARPEREKNYAEYGHGADDQRSRRQVARERQRKSGCVPKRTEQVAGSDSSFSKAARCEGRNNQRRKHEVQADELHGNRNRAREENIETDAPE